MAKSEAARSFGVSLSSVKRYGAKAREGTSLLPRRHPGPRPKIDERARKLLEADVEKRPYSPDLNPIEEAFSKVKSLLRKAEARSRERLVEAMGWALEAVTAKDARGYFEHRGYQLLAQQL
jgi:transposase